MHSLLSLCYNLFGGCMINNIFIKNLPTIDLHGYDRDSAKVEIEDFIEENIIMKNKKVVIIHGIGEGIVKKRVHECLKKSHLVDKFEVDIYNEGCTIVWLKFD